MKLSLLLAAGTLAAQLTGAVLAPTQGRPQPRPRTKPAAAHLKAPVAYGAKADSLGGIPGHRFGEPRSNFPELETRGFNNLDDYVSYSLRDNQPEGAGWFGKHADQVRATYWFRHDQFAGFTATQHSWDNQPLLAGEVLYLFGPGKRMSEAFGQATTRWEGKQVLVEYVSGHNEGTLTISSQPVLAQVAAAKRAQQQAAAAARAASLKADNAVPVR